MSAPTVLNAAYNPLQFWDGRAVSLEDQAQGPVQNALEMFDGDGHAWKGTVQRLRKKPGYTEAANNLAIILFSAKRYAKAKEVLDRAEAAGASPNAELKKAVEAALAKPM